MSAELMHVRAVQGSRADPGAQVHCPLSAVGVQLLEGEGTRTGDVGDRVDEGSDPADQLDRFGCQSQGNVPGRTVAGGALHTVACVARPTGPNS